MTVSAIEDFLVRPVAERTQSGALKELAESLSKAQAEMETAAKDAENPHFRSKYADLASVWAACRAALSKHGLAVVQQPVGDGTRVGLTTTLLHMSGQFMSSTIYASPKDTGPQAIGSVLTYLRRYSLAAVVGCAPAEGEDDDGNAAGGGARPNAPAPRPANDNAKPARRAGPPPAHDDPPAPSSSEVTPPPIGPTLKQQREYRKLSEALGISGDEARARVSTFLGRPVGGLQEVSVAEMDRLLAAMEAQKNGTA